MADLEWAARLGSAVRQHTTVVFRTVRVTGCQMVLAGVSILLGPTPSTAQIAVTPGGQAAYSFPITVPPGMGGVAPKLSLAYTDGGINGPVGVGWSLQGVSMITRCPATRPVDGKTRPVFFDSDDKLCLDGQRLIQTNALGNPASIAQSGDAWGCAGGENTFCREYRTEKDSYMRIRAYGAALTKSSGVHGVADLPDIYAGPLYFKVWTKSGQVMVFGGSANPTASIRGGFTTQGGWDNARPVVLIPIVVWAVSRIQDPVGNFIDFNYSQFFVPWGSDPTSTGSEWHLSEVRYAGRGSIAAPNKVTFEYEDKPLSPSAGMDRAEAYQWGLKSVTTKRLSKISTYINNTSTPVAVRTVNIGYEQSPATGRSRVTTIKECAGTGTSKCLPPTSFRYTDGSLSPFVANEAFGTSLGTLTLQSASGGHGVLMGDFNGDGRTDILRWADNAANNQILFSVGGGAFSQQAVLTDTKLFSIDGCNSSTVGDFNGDGLTDILRTVKTNCTGTNTLYLSKGDGTFDTRTLPTSIDLEQLTSVRHEAGGKACPIQPRGTKSSGRSSTNSNLNSNRPRAQIDNYPPTPGALPPQDNGSRGARGSGPSVEEGGPCVYFEGTLGKRFYVLDLNGDGILDIVTTMVPPYAYTAMPSEAPFGDLCQQSLPPFFWSDPCTKVYFGNGEGGFEQSGTSVEYQSLYSDPPGPLGNPYWQVEGVVDLNGDGLQDIISTYSGRWRSLGDGNFNSSPTTDTSQLCGTAIDFNGDGRGDCLFPTDGTSTQILTLSFGAVSSGALPQFNLTAPEDALYVRDGQGNQIIGMVIGDFNGDGRQDILRWGQSPSANGIYLSNGDGTFQPRVSAGLGSIADPLQHANGSTNFVMGDFLGVGSLQILHIRRDPTASLKNALYVRLAEPGPPDLLDQVTSPTGQVSRIDMRLPLTASNGRYVSERSVGTINPSILVDLQPPIYVVTSTSQDNPSDTLRTEHLYKGFKAERGGRGLLGFREIQQKVLPAREDGIYLTTATEYLLQHPYNGAASRVIAYRDSASGFPLNGASELTATINLYCDTTSLENPSVATVSRPCASAALVTRPYLFQSVTTAKDLDGTVLPTTKTTNSYNSFGDPTTIFLCAGVCEVLGAASDFTKATTNTYCTPDVGDCPNRISGDNWILGRLTGATVTSTVPNVFNSLTASPGTAPLATATTGQLGGSGQRSAGKKK